ncbi:UNVERIFIED_ORG: DUF1320 domain-containing protein [Shinella sp. XGS7]|nr:DUF1320 domain-containing protein [Shinella sp. XGS7]
MYATPQDMIDRLGTPRLVQLTDIQEPMTGAIGAVVLDRALADATAEIDGYLVGRLALPLATPPAILKVHCCTIAHYRLLGSTAGEGDRKAYEQVLAYLAKVAKGEIVLMPPAEAPALQGLGPVMFDAGTKVMGREDL